MTNVSSSTGDLRRELALGEHHDREPDSFVLAGFAGRAAQGRAGVGALVVDGGGESAETIKRFVALAGGVESPIVLIPTASESEQIDLKQAQQAFTRRFKFKHVTVLHTRDRAEADKEEFVGTSQGGPRRLVCRGRQWRLVDAYLGTRTQREIEAVLSRGGVIGGSSAGGHDSGLLLASRSSRGESHHDGQGVRGRVRLSEGSDR